MAHVVEPTPAAVEEAAALLREGALVAFPTETVYGLGAAARDVSAVQRVYRLKGRPSGHPLIVHLPGPEHVERWARASPVATELARAFWPGPLTLVLRRSPGVPDAVTGGQPTVALRTPRHPVAEALLKAFGDGVAAPSANRFGRISPTTAAHVAAEFPGDLLVLDGGPTEVGLESTILDLSEGPTAPVRLLRPGGVPVAAIEEFLGRHVQLPLEFAGSVPRVSGSLTSHYAARAPTEVVAADRLVARALAGGGAVAVLALRPAPAGYVGHWIQLAGEPVAYGRELYAALRELDAAEPALILVEAVPSGAAWLAVRDRLTRASARRGAS